MALKVKKNFMAPFLRMRCNCFKTAEPLRGDSKLFTTKSLGVPGTHLIDLGRMRGLVDLGAKFKSLSIIIPKNFCSASVYKFLLPNPIDSLAISLFIIKHVVAFSRI